MIYFDNIEYRVPTPTPTSLESLLDAHSVFTKKFHHTLAMPSLCLAASLTSSESLRTYPFSNIRVMYCLL